MKVLKTLRMLVKAIGLLDAFIDELERENAVIQAEKDRARQKMSDIYQGVSNLTGKDRSKN